MSRRRPGSLPPLLVRSAGPMIGREAASAGTPPHTIPVRPESSSANARTRRSIAKSSGSGSAPAGGGAAANAWSKAQARATPARPPISDSSTLSVRSCCSSRPRLAPSARRTASSRRRPAARDSSRLAMLAHAISSTVPTTPPSRSAAERSCGRGPRSGSSTDRRVTRGGVAPGGSFTRVRKNSASTGSSSAPARSIVTSALRRPTPKIQLLVACWSRSGFCSPE